MLHLSEIMLQNHDVETFEQLVEVVKRAAATSGEIHFRIDIKPPFPDTPDNWEDRLEGAFCGVHSVTK
ncbi:MAG: sulfur relay protein DsrC [Gammaproteobacteria bacterium]|nr:MAG: sulfur relay protein DsrC [Gammaproteobacteria bacterium]